MAKAKVITLWVITVLVALSFVLAGAPKVLVAPMWVDMFANWGYAKWFVIAIGVAEIAGAVLLAIPRTAFYGGLFLMAIMLGAAYTHVTHSETAEIIRPGLYLVFLAIVAWARRPRVTGT